MKRLLTAAALIPAAVYLILFAPRPAFVAAALFMAVMCFGEYRRLAAAHGAAVWGPFGYAAGLALLLAPRAELLVAILVLLVAFTLALAGEDLRQVLLRAAALAAGLLYIFGAWRCGIHLRDLNPHWLLFALALVWVGDSTAYYVGKRFGRHRMAPRLSPAKTWEGAASSMAASLVFGVFYLRRFLAEVAPAEAVGLSVAAAVAGQFGDLVESALKRGAGVKDSGTLLPGHGGFLDRLDSSLFTMPVVYCWLARPWQS
jgi:phosphatidate cytidylyltransferase